MTNEEETRAMFAVLIDKLNRIEHNTATTRSAAPAPDSAQAVVDAALKKVASALSASMETKKMLEAIRRDL